MPVTSLQPCLTNTRSSEIKLGREIFPLDLAAGHRRAGAGVTAPSTGMLPAKREDGPRRAQAARRPPAATAPGAFGPPRPAESRAGSAGAGRASAPRGAAPPLPRELRRVRALPPPPFSFFLDYPI